MRAEVFVDTNILYYANIQSPDLRHRRARERMRYLWAIPGRAAVSIQVVQELHVNLMRKAKLMVEKSAQRISHYLAWRVIDNDRSLLSSGIDIQSRWGLSFRDSLIVAAAQRSGASQLWSEDLSVGQRFGDVVVVNSLEQGHDQDDTRDQTEPETV